MYKFKTLAAIALAVLCSAVCISCGDDNEPTPSTKKDKYLYQSALSNDFLDLYDVTITKKVGTKTEIVQLSDNCKLVVENTESTREYSGKSTPKFTIEVDKGVNVSVTATAQLKSNWKDIINSKDELNLYYSTSYCTAYGQISALQIPKAIGYTIGKDKYDKWTQELYTELGAHIADQISMNDD